MGMGTYSSIGFYDDHEDLTKLLRRQKALAATDFDEQSLNN